jgi:hypothetical protein
MQRSQRAAKITQAIRRHPAAAISKNGQQAAIVSQDKTQGRLDIYDLKQLKKVKNFCPWAIHQCKPFLFHPIIAG